MSIIDTPTFKYNLENLLIILRNVYKHLFDYTCLNNENCEVIERKGDELIVRLADCVKMNARVSTSDGKEIGRVVRVMGPGNGPFALVKLRVPNFEGKEVTIRC